MLIYFLFDSELIQTAPVLSSPERIPALRLEDLTPPEPPLPGEANIGRGQGHKRGHRNGEQAHNHVSREANHTSRKSNQEKRERNQVNRDLNLVFRDSRQVTVEVADRNSISPCHADREPNHAPTSVVNPSGYLREGAPFENSGSRHHSAPISMAEKEAAFHNSLEVTVIKSGFLGAALEKKGMYARMCIFELFHLFNQIFK